MGEVRKIEKDWLRAFLFFLLLCFMSICNPLVYIRPAPASLHIYVHVNDPAWPDAPIFARFLPCLAAYCTNNPPPLLKLLWPFLGFGRFEMPQSKYINIKRKYDRRKKKNLFGSFFYRINDNKLKRDEGRGGGGAVGRFGNKTMF